MKGSLLSPFVTLAAMWPTWFPGAGAITTCPQP